jgi:hypothetical protein
MHYSRLAVVLLAVMTFSLDAFGQTRSAIGIFRPPSLSAMARLTVPASTPPCPGSFPPYYCQSIPRYKNTGLFGITEYQMQVDANTGLIDCQYQDYGNWTVTSTVSPQSPYTGQPAGVASQGQAFQGPPPTPANGGPCTGTVGTATYMYAPIDFDWLLERNDTAIPNFGPSATFTAEWVGQLGNFGDYSFVITVPVVRPQSEVLNPVGFEADATHFRYYQTLIPTPDPTAPDGNNGADFDFTGEAVNESLNTTSLGCQGLAPLPAIPSSGGSQFRPGNVGKWKVGFDFYTGEQLSKNQFGPDSVGYNGRCLIETFRCAGVTIPACGYRITQVMLINSPADPQGTFVGYMMHKLGADIGGSILPGGIAPNYNRVGTGGYRVLKDTWMPSPGGITTSLNDCPNSEITRVHYLQLCPGHR